MAVGSAGPVPAVLPVFAAGRDPARQRQPPPNGRTYRTGEPLTPAAGGGRAPAFEATPVYADSLLYTGTPYRKVVALAPETRKPRWVFDARINTKGNYGDFANLMTVPLPETR
jgi:hypothetical protein